MISHEIIIIIMLISLLGALMLGFPVAFTLSGVALIFGVLGTRLAGQLEPREVIRVGSFHLDCCYLGYIRQEIREGL